MTKSNYSKTYCNTPMVKAIYDSSITAGNMKKGSFIQPENIDRFHCQLAFDQHGLPGSLP